MGCTTVLYLKGYNLLSDDDIIISRSESFNLLGSTNRKLVKASLDLNDNGWDQIEFED